MKLLNTFLNKVSKKDFKNMIKSVAALKLFASSMQDEDILRSLYVLSFNDIPNKDFSIKEAITRRADAKEKLNLVERQLIAKEVCTILKNASALFDSELANITNNDNNFIQPKNPEFIKSAKFGLLANVNGKYHLVNPLTNRVASEFIIEAADERYAKLHELIGQYRKENKISYFDESDGMIILTGSPEVINDVEHKVKDIGYYCESVNEETGAEGEVPEYSLKIFTNTTAAPEFDIEKAAAKHEKIGEDSKLINDEEFGILFEVKFENKAVKGSLELTKTGEEVELTDNGYIYTKINLKGVKIGLYARENIYDALGNLKYKKGTLVKELITDKNGYVKVDDLYLGKYYLQEIETINNHVLDKTKYNFNLEYKDQYTEVINYKTTLENHLPKGTLEFTKSDYSDSKTLPNTLIEIYNENDELVYSGRTDENGKIIIDKLPVGKYYILEKEAPEGYKINEEKMYFEITEDGQVVKCNMLDEAYEVPNTGLSSINYELIGSIVLIVSGLGLFLYGTKKRK